MLICIKNKFKYINMDKKKYCILCIKFGHYENVCGYRDWITNTPLDLFNNFDL